MSPADLGQIVAAVLAAAWVVTLLCGPVVPARTLAGTGVATALFALPAALSDEIVDAGRGPTPLDSAVEAVILAHRTPALTSVAQLFDLAAGTVSLALLAAVVAAVLMGSGRRFEAVLLVGATAAAGVLIYVLKLVYSRPRPPVALRLIPESGFSLPSGHALGATVVLGTLAVVAWSLLRPGVTRVLLAVVAGALVAATGTSRVYLGVHWATDVIDGWLVGGACVALAAVALARRTAPTRTPAPAA
jgi:membrane-associated phospholipid phosphatase